MKQILILPLMLAQLAFAAEINVKSVGDRSQPLNNPMTTTAVKEWSLAPAKACTTISKDIAGLGGFSMQLWDSVKTGTGNVDTIIINMKFQIANKDTTTAFNCTGLSDSTIYAAETRIASASAASKKGYVGVIDFSSQVPRCGFIRYIIRNDGPDTCRAIRMFPNYNMSTQ